MKILTTYKTYTFDSYLALVGGYAGITTFLITLVMNGYQEFAYERSLVRILYKSNRKGDVHEGSEVHNPKDEVKRVINGSKMHDFTFWQRVLAKIVLTCCCCCSEKDCYKRKKKRNQAQIQMMKRLSSEVDV